MCSNKSRLIELAFQLYTFQLTSVIGLVLWYYECWGMFYKNNFHLQDRIKDVERWHNTRLQNNAQKKGNCDGTCTTLLWQHNVPCTRWVLPSRKFILYVAPKAGKIGNSNVAGKVTVIKKNVLVSLCSSMFCCTLYLKVNHVYKVRMHPTKRMCSKQAFKKMSAISLPHPLDVMFAGSLQMLKFTGWQVWRRPNFSVHNFAPTLWCQSCKCNVSLYFSYLFDV